jgi:predicted transposase YbfD/YdcC
MATSSRLSPSGVPCIRTCFETLPDPRRRLGKVRHSLLNIVVIALCGTIAGADSFEEIAAFAEKRRDWLGRFLDLSDGVPSHDTLERVFAALNPVAFQKCLVDWIGRLHEVTRGQVIAIDGKAVREAMKRSSDQGPLMLVSAWATESRVFLGQVAGPKGSGESAALPKLLELLELEGAIVTLDALGCQRSLTRQIIERKGDYLISVKGNQRQLLSAVQATLEVAEAAEKAAEKAADESKTAETIEKKSRLLTRTMQEASHGRNDERVVTVMEIPTGSPHQEQFGQWSGLKTVVRMTRTGTNSKGAPHSGTRYFITSLAADAKRLAEVVRRHWGVENEMNWTLDVAFREDHSRARTDDEQANFGAVRRTALSLLKHAPGLKGSMHCKRQQAAWDESTLENVLFGREATQD